MAMTWFREKWLAIDMPEEFNDDRVLESTLYHVGDAIGISFENTVAFELTPDEKDLLVRLIGKWSSTSLPVEFIHPMPIATQDRQIELNNAILGITALLVHLDIPQEIAKAVYEKHKQLLTANVFTMPLLIGLANAQVSEREGIIASFRRGLVSENENHVFNTAFALRVWLHFAKTGVVSSPPDDLIREIGFAVTTRRHPEVRVALSLTQWIFEHGQSDHQELILKHTIDGLGFLIHELDYQATKMSNFNHLPTMRQCCVEISRALIKNGHDHPHIQSWLELARKDPLPELRFAISDINFPSSGQQVLDSQS